LVDDPVDRETGICEVARITGKKTVAEFLETEASKTFYATWASTMPKVFCGISAASAAAADHAAAVLKGARYRRGSGSRACTHECRCGEQPSQCNKPYESGRRDQGNQSGSVDRNP
jgi:hypothetical protein